MGISALEILGKKFFYILLVVCITSSISGSVAAKNNNEIPEEFSAEKISSFVNYLVENGDYYRAYSELKRLESYYPGYISPFCYNITESYIFYKSRQYDKILNKCNKKEYDESSCAENIFIIDSLLKSGNFNHPEMIKYLTNDLCSGSEYSTYYHKRILYRSVFNRFNDYEIQAPADYSEYNDSYNYAVYLRSEKKSPIFGAFSGIIPGMGYLYAGEAGTGIVAFIVTAAGSAITYGAYINGVEPLAAVSGAATFFFYTGSIAGGYMQTVKYNRRLSEQLILRLDKDFMLEKDIDSIYIKCGLQSNGR